MDQIDKAIDDVARKMTEAHEAPDFRARVLARIEHFEDQRSRRSALKVLALCVAGGAVVVLVLAIARAPWRTPIGTPAVPPAAGVRVGSPRNVPGPQVERADERPALERPTGGAARQIARTTASDFEPLDRASGIAPLEPAPIELQVISIDDMEEMESIDVTRLTVPTIEVPAL